MTKTFEDFFAIYNNPRNYWEGFKPYSLITTNSTGSGALVLKPKEVFSFNLAGCPKEAIDVEIDDDVLKVQAEWKEGEETRRFVQSININYAIDYNNCNCEYRDGLLTIKVPKKSNKKTLPVL